MTRFLYRAAGLLVLPLAALLFAQWPLREVVHAWSRQANDIAQIVFAVYMAIALSAASRDGKHLAAGHAHDEESGPPRRWKAWAVLACTAPWTLFLLWTSAPGIWQSLVQSERFGETLTPGFFVVKLALWLMAVLVLVQALGAALRRTTPGP